MKCYENWDVYNLLNDTNVFFSEFNMGFVGVWYWYISLWHGGNVKCEHVP
jgi:hypothetical protein